ncbi:MAG TPA: Fe-S cluster assembly protein SufD [Candidatus Sulfotelmatobacter sp.]|nr:Fe-S cluster assembly protein SufD [Candidatus Sulfotelmatobacter sp.]
MSTTTIDKLDSYLESFNAFTKRAAGHDQPWLKKLREDAFARFCETGFPTTRDEDWRFTNVSAIARSPFLLPHESGEINNSDLKPWRMEGAAAQMVFVDGQFARELSQIRALPAGVEVSSLKPQLAKHDGAARTHLGKYLSLQRDPFCALNTAFAEDGAFVFVPRGTVLAAPIHLLFVSTTADSPRMIHPRNLVIFEQESQGALIEEYVSLGGGSVLCNTATELIAGESAHVSHYMIEREHSDAFNISTLRIQQARSANVASHSLLLGGGLVRNNVHPVLAGEGGECLINGLFVGAGRQHLDNYMHVEHAAPHCSSRQFYNGILDEHSHGVFHGRIVVHKDAQKTDAKQTNRNLLLSDDAQIDTKPQLEIYADDVKCTHGATIGQIDENALFYLRSRGIPEVSARRLLLFAFASECVDRMKEGIARHHSERLIHEQLLSVANHLHLSAPSGGRQSERNWEEVG